MQNSDIKDSLCRNAVEAIDNGDIAALTALLEANPQLVSKRLEVPTDGYFKHPYLLWFVADNPIRHEKLPANIVDITRLLIHFVKQHAMDSFELQRDYTLGLVATGRIPRECGVQIALIDLLIDEGAKTGRVHGTLAHGNIEAAAHLIERGGELTLTAAVGLDRMNDVLRLLNTSTIADKQVALVAASFFGKGEMIKLLLDHGVDVNAYIENGDGFHSHATALHQAVYSGSLDCVKLLVDAGASLNAEDRIYHGTPLGWAMHMQTEENDETARKKYAEIETFLLSKQQA